MDRLLHNKIEILSIQLLNTERATVEQMRETSKNLAKGLGWHYLLDLSWAAQQLDLREAETVLDAGAGIGVMQWWLAEKGVDVISVDQWSRSNISDKFRQRYRIKGWRNSDLSSPVGVRDILPPRSPLRWHLYPLKLMRTGMRVWKSANFRKQGGIVYIYNQDLSNMTDIPDNSVDAIVSISALEHNPPEGLRTVVRELMRVLKLGGKLIATLGAAKDQDWFHEPSQGWCYTEETLRDLFDLPEDYPSNYDRYDELFEKLKNCVELRDNLAEFYFKSGYNGMPWGEWNPRYQSVGVVKKKM